VAKSIKAPTTISGQLLAAIQAEVERGTTLYRIAADSGVSQPQVSRFVSGERGLTLPSIDRLAVYLGLELSPISRR
jgi:plasmid maintenance system antidote protein VapI